MAIVPGKRMGTSPRSFAADAHDRIMVPVLIGPTEYKAVARAFAPVASSASERLPTSRKVQVNAATDLLKLDNEAPIQGGPASIRPAMMRARVRLEGAHHLWRKVPSGELSIDPEADERRGWATGLVEAS